jgi:xylulokinase
VRQVADPIQANVCGAAFIAAVGLGILSYDDVPERTEYRREYLPTPAHRDVYDASFKEFVDIYRQNKRIYRRLNGRRTQFH